MIAVRKLLTILLAALPLLFALPARAQSDDVRVSAGVSSTRAYLGDAIQFTISIESDAVPPRPQVEIDGFAVEEAGDSRSQSLQIINGRRRSTVTIDYHYLLRPQREGTIQIPPIDVPVNGSVYRTQPVWVSVERPGQTEDFRIIVRPSKQTCYVGEPVTLNATIYFAAPLRGLWPSMPVDEDRARVDAARGLPQLPRGVRGQETLEVEIDGRQVSGVLGQVSLDGRAFRTLTFEQILTPAAPGRLEVGPVTVALDEIVGEDPRGFFDSPLRDRTRTRRVVIASDPVSLEVRPLPEAGRPANFTGLVGNYTMEIAADRSSANVGDPIELTVRINGPEPMRAARPPDLDAPGVTESFRTDSEGWRRLPDSGPGQRAYSTTVRARSGEVTAFPALSLPYFDPELGEYRAARCGPIPLRIRPTTVVTAEDAEFGPSPAVRRRLGAGPPGLLANAPAEVALTSTAPALALRRVAPALGVALLAPPAACALVVAAGRRRQRADRPSARAALRAARRRLAQDGPESAALAVQTYLALRLGMAPGAVSADDAAAALDTHPDLGAQARTLLQDCDAVRYRAGAIGDRSLRDRAAALLRALAREGLPR
ncbi:MAG: BatD family protein [Phycisphaerales bacterium JB039]